MMKIFKIPISITIIFQFKFDIQFINKIERDIYIYRSSYNKNDDYIYV